jgi:Na+/H+ antiporter NhaD/arsenite permease-like protein
VAFDGATLPLYWGIPFAGLLLSIALVPLVASHFWHRRYGTVAAGWTLALLAPFALAFGPVEALHHVVHAILQEYVPFLAILFALFTISGGIGVRGTLAGTPALNTTLLALGAGLASFMGTTGASMLLIRPLLSANATRLNKVHTVVFFILLAGNVGGALSPLGDPPLFIGFLKGVDFFWTTRALAMPTVFLTVVLLTVFFLLDTILYRRETPPSWTSPSPWALRAAPPVEGAASAVPSTVPSDRKSIPAASTAAPPRERLQLEGIPNFILLAGVIGAVLMSGFWKPGIEFDVAGAHVELQNAARDVALILLGLASLAITPKIVREHNQFHWAPIIEVAKLFAAIFVTIFPVLAILGAGENGAFAGMIQLLADKEGVPREDVVYWVTGVLSAFLDNAPTYLVFFNLAGGDAQRLMDVGTRTLSAISMGAVYFGALTYIGNAPNFMIKAIAEDRGVAMPSFFAYLAYASLVMLPLLAVVGWLWV